MNKKAIVILTSIFLLIVGTLGFLIYSRSSSKKTENISENVIPSPTPPETNVNPLPTMEPENQSKVFVKLTDSEQIISPILFYNGNGITFFDNSGGLLKADFDNNAEDLKLVRNRNLDIEKKSGIERILWPKNGDDFIAEFSDSKNEKSYSFFNFSTGSYINLPKQVKSVEWMPSGDKILFVWTDTDSQGKEKTTLNVSKPDTSEYKEIAELYESDDVFYISPDGLNLVFHRTKNSDSVNKIVQTSPDGKIWKDLVKEGYNYGILWSPDSQKFLFSKLARNGGGYQLWYYDLYNGEVKNLGLYTLPLKAVWSFDSKSIYASVPAGNLGIRDYMDLKNTFTTDVFYKLDVNTLEKKEFKAEGLSIDGRDLFLNPSEDKLFFKNAQDNALYYLNLKSNN